MAKKLPDIKDVAGLLETLEKLEVTQAKFQALADSGVLKLLLQKDSHLEELARYPWLLDELCRILRIKPHTGAFVLEAHERSFDSFVEKVDLSALPEAMRRAFERAIPRARSLGGIVVTPAPFSSEVGLFEGLGFLASRGMRLTDPAEFLASLHFLAKLLGGPQVPLLKRDVVGGFSGRKLAGRRTAPRVARIGANTLHPDQFERTGYAPDHCLLDLSGIVLVTRR